MFRSRHFALRACTRLLGLFLLAAVAAPAALAAPKDLTVAPALPPASALGAYSGSTSFALGEVKDATFSESPTHVGIGPAAMYQIVTAKPRAETTRAALADAFGRVGLLAKAPAEPTYTVDVTLRRFRTQTHAGFARFRLRSEIFLEFDFRQAGQSVGRVLAAGNSQQYAQLANKGKYEDAFQVAFNDAVHKLFNSRTLARLAGAGWAPVPAPLVSGEKSATRIAKDEFYGPTDRALAEAAAAATSMQAGAGLDTLRLPDFALDRVGGDQKSAVADADYARALLPALIEEHLNAFYPGAFTTIARGPAATSGPGLVVDGNLDNFRVGNRALQVWVGFGAGKDELKGRVDFKDGATGAALHGFNAGSSNWGAGWQSKKGTIRDMADQLARDIAYFLVRTTRPNYQPPQDIEVLFDATPYPSPQRKS